MIKIEFRKRRKQTTEAMKIWFKWLEEYNSGMTVAEVAKSHINPKTNKPYTKANVYFAFHRLEELTA